MTLSVFCILLFAALLHASWNAIVKAGNDKLYSAIGVTGSAALIALLLLPFAPAPSAASVPFMVASTVLQVIYTVLVAKTYQISDMSQTYPLMRGTAPLLVAIISVLFLGDHLSTLAWCGIAVIAAERLDYCRLHPDRRHRCAPVRHRAGLYAMVVFPQWLQPAVLGDDRPPP